MKKKAYKILHTTKIIIFAGILVLPSLAWGLVTLLYPDEIENWDSGLKENRQKAEFPTTFNAATITAELEDYYNDHAPFRSLLILAYQKQDSNLENIYLSSIKPALSIALYGRGETSEEEIGKYDIGSLFQDEVQSGNEADSEIAEPATEEHHYIELSRTDATCTEPGSILYECTDCGEQHEEIIPAAGHQNTLIESKEASYTEYGYDLYVCSVCNIISKENITGKLIDTSYFAPVALSDTVVAGRYDWLFYTGENYLSYYKKTNVMSEEKMQDFLNTTTELKTLCDENDIQLQLMLIPNKSQVYPEFMPTYTIEEGKSREETLLDYLESNSGPTILYPLEELTAVKPYWPTYYSHDTHWNLVGGFIGAQALYKELGIPTTNILNLEYSAEPRLGGDLMILGGVDPQTMLPDMEYGFYYKTDVSITEMSGNIDANILSCHSTADNECNMVLLGDSFRVNMTPYLIRDFSHCTIAHRSYVNQLADSIRDADVLIICSVERYDEAFLKVMKDTIKILRAEE